MDINQWVDELETMKEEEINRLNKLIVKQDTMHEELNELKNTLMM